MSDYCNQCGGDWRYHGSACKIAPAVITRFEVVGTADPVWPTITGGNITTTITKLVGVPFCPDLLSIEDMGEADGWRGQVVRGFFHALGAVDRWLL